MINKEDKNALKLFYERLYEYINDHFSNARINLSYTYKETDLSKPHPYWLYFPSRIIKLHIAGVNLIVKFDQCKLGFEYKVDKKYYPSLKKVFSKIDSLRKYYKRIKYYECLFEESRNTLFIYIDIPYIDIKNDLNEQLEELSFLGNALLDFCYFHRRLGDNLDKICNL